MCSCKMCAAMGEIPTALRRSAGVSQAYLDEINLFSLFNAQLVQLPDAEPAEGGHTVLDEIFGKERRADRDVGGDHAHRQVDAPDVLAIDADEPAVLSDKELQSVGGAGGVVVGGGEGHELRLLTGNDRVDV